MSQLDIFKLVLPALAPVLVGWLVVRLKFMAATDAKSLSSAFLYIFLPALLVEHLARQNVGALFDTRFILATGSLMLAIYVALLVIHSSLLHRPLDSSAVAAFAGSKFNAVVVGLPLLIIPIGREAIVPVIINLVLGYFTILPLTLVLLEVAKARQMGRETRLSTTVLRAIRHVVVDPLVSATLIGLLLSALHIAIPAPLDEILATLGSAAIPVPLVAVGMTICASGLKENRGEILWMSAARVLIAPVLAIAVARLFALSPFFSIALVISFSLPTAKMVFALAEDHGVYVAPAAGIVTVTTLATIIIYPFFIWLCEQLWPGTIGQHLHLE